MMVETVHGTDKSPNDQDCPGHRGARWAPTLAGTRMGGQDIVSHVQRNGGEVQRVAEGFPYLTVEVIEAVLIWYREHQEEIDEILREQRANYQRLLAETRARQ